MTTSLPEEPVVSVVIPMLNEMESIDACLSAFESQTWPTERLDIVVVDGGSDDGSRDHVEEMSGRFHWLRVVDNPRRKASAAFNVGVAAATGDVVCLFSAHGVPDPSYVASSVNALRETGADGVGGRYLHIGVDAKSNAIGLAMVSPFGMASPHRFANSRREVDTISHPAYLRESLVRVGPFDESLERNSDYELNFRMREIGMKLVFDPEIVSVYRPRRSLAALGRQFWWYGRWKERVVRSHPGSLRPRHLVAPLAVTGVAAAPIICISRQGRRLVSFASLAYLVGVFAAVVGARPRQNAASPGVLAACFPVMHGSWGAGFVTSFFQDLLQRKRR